VGEIRVEGEDEQQEMRRAGKVFERSESWGYCLMFQGGKEVGGKIRAEEVEDERRSNPQKVERSESCGCSDVTRIRSEEDRTSRR